MQRGTALRGTAAAPPSSSTITEDELYRLRSEASSNPSKGAETRRSETQAVAGVSRAERMRELDIRKLKEKGESGALEGEHVEALVKKLGEELS
jgi:hypothetical protein